MSDTITTPDDIFVVPIHTHPDDVWQSVRRELARIDERLLRLEEQQLLCQMRDDELCRAACRRG